MDVRASDSRIQIRWGRVAAFGLATWFVALSALRLSVLIGAPFTDAQLYLRATRTWISGGDPWSVHIGDVYYAAPPPSLLPLAPFAVLPEPVAIGILFGLGVAASAWSLRRLGLPLWWMAWPPLVDNLANGNPQIFVVPLLLGAHAWLAPIVKTYAIAPIALTLRGRQIVAVAIALAVTVPLLPWPIFIDRFFGTVSVLHTQSDGGMSAWVHPVLLLPLGVIAIVAMGRERAAWWFVPVLWPSTQWYYSVTALPAVTPVTAALLAVPIQGMPVLAALVLVAEIALTRSGPLATGWLPPWSARTRLGHAVDDRRDASGRGSRQPPVPRGG